MLKWLLTTALALVVLTAAMPWLARRFGIGRMPGDMRFTVVSSHLSIGSG